MKTTHTILTITSAFLIIGSSLYASENTMLSQPNNESATSQVQKTEKKNKKIRQRADQFGQFNRALRKLELTQDQTTQIKTFRQEKKAQMKLDRKEFIKCSAFSKKEFSKKLYVIKAEEKAQSGISLKADFIGKVYTILTPEQKEKLFVAMRESRKQKNTKRRANLNR